MISSIAEEISVRRPSENFSLTARSCSSKMDCSLLSSELLDQSQLRGQLILDFEPFKSCKASERHIDDRLRLDL